VGALLGVVVVIAAIVLGGGSTYTLHITFENASGLVSGDEILIGPAQVGTVQSIGLTRDGQAEVVIALQADAAPLRQGTTAWIEDVGLAAIASNYIVLYPGPSGDPAIPSGGSIAERDAYPEVSLDELFDTLDPLTRAGIRGLIRGEAAAIHGRAAQANATIHYLEPALASTSQLTAQLAGDEPAFDGLLVQGAQTLQALATRSQQLTALIANTDASTGALASQAQALRSALSLLPATLTRSTTTFAGLRATLDALDPVVAQAKPAARRLPELSAALGTLALQARPTVNELAELIRSPTGSGDLTSLLAQTPSLSRIAASAFPQLIAEMNDSQNQLDYLREYTPDVVAALTNLGQASAYYDANGHYTRTQPFFGAFGLDASDELTSQPPPDRYNGLSVVHGRCPGGAAQASPDGSAPEQVPGCNPSSSPGG
jgi:phospholipid/cholesterol/gamma-HCH transport system substrate-binding protein